MSKMFQQRKELAGPAAMPNRLCAWLLVTVIAVLGFGGTCSAQAPPGEIAGPPPPRFEALILARKYVQEYFDKFSTLTCKESVTQLLVNGSGHTLYRENSAYNYQFEATSASGSLKFNET